MSHVVARRVTYLPSHFICPGDGWMSHAVAHRVTIFLPISSVQETLTARASERRIERSQRRVNYFFVKRLSTRCKVAR